MVLWVQGIYIHPDSARLMFASNAKPAPADDPRLFYHLTKDVFPQAYFSKMLKGEWYGPRGVFPPQFVPS